MRILFLTDFFPPETNAAASRVFERARYWVKWGHEVTVVASVPNFPQGRVYPGYRNRWYQVEEMEGVRVVRVKTFMASNRGKWRRQLDLVSYLFSALPAAIAEPKADVVVATSPNFFAGLAGCMAAIIRRRPFVLEIGDLWPAFAISLGKMRRSIAYRTLEGIERFMYRQAERIVCLTPSFGSELAARGVEQAKLAVVLNGVELDLFLAPAGGEERRRDGAFLVGYFGTQGLAHGLESAIDAAVLVPEAEFLFVGNGAFHEDLQMQARRLGADNVRFLPQQPRERMPEIIRSCDAALVQLRDLPLLNTAIPSKIFEAMASGKPVLLAAPQGDASELIEKEGCGVRVRPGSADELAGAVRKMMSDPDMVHRLGENGRVAALCYGREHQAHEMLLVLVEAAGSIDGES